MATLVGLRKQIMDVRWQAEAEVPHYNVHVLLTYFRKKKKMHSQIKLLLRLKLEVEN